MYLSLNLLPPTLTNNNHVQLVFETKDCALQGDIIILFCNYLFINYCLLVSLSSPFFFLLLLLFCPFSFSSLSLLLSPDL